MATTKKTQEPAATKADINPAPVDAPPPSPSAARPSFFRRMRPVGRGISGLIAGISFVTGIIAVVPIFTRDASNFDSLRVTAAAFGGELEYGVPSTAPFDTFPDGAAGACGPDQQAWLEANGTRITTKYLIDMRNVASEGAMLALKSFRGVGKASDDAPLIKVVCDPTGGGGAAVQAARLLVSDPSQVAYFDKSALGQTNAAIPDSPVVWNLAPGETGQMIVEVFPTTTFTGTLALTAFSGKDSRDFPIPVDDAKKLKIPGLAYGGMTFLRVDGTLTCVDLTASTDSSCEIGDLLG